MNLLSHCAQKESKHSEGIVPAVTQEHFPAVLEFLKLFCTVTNSYHTLRLLREWYELINTAQVNGPIKPSLSNIEA